MNPETIYWILIAGSLASAVISIRSLIRGRRARCAANVELVLRRVRGF